MGPFFDKDGQPKPRIRHGKDGQIEKFFSQIFLARSQTKKSRKRENAIGDAGGMVGGKGRGTRNFSAARNVE